MKSSAQEQFLRLLRLYTPCSLRKWKSHRSRRVARSTMSATIRCDSCVDCTQFFSAFIAVAIHGCELKDGAAIVSHSRILPPVRDGSSSI
eukprot:2833067-Amphidinium_carterae.1